MTNTFERANWSGGNSERGQRPNSQQLSGVRWKKNTQQSKWQTRQAPIVGHPQRPAIGAYGGYSSYSGTAGTEGNKMLGKVAMISSRNDVHHAKKPYVAPRGQ